MSIVMQVDKGIQQSFGFMVNYVYLLDNVEQNNAEYVTKGIVTMTFPIQDAFQSLYSKANIQTIDYHAVSQEKL
jgi:hypothetical protein